MKKDSTIVLLRVLAMFMIIFTHLCQFYNWVAVRSILFGVPLFLLISGYLYGNKTITNIKAFFVGRWKKIIVPVWIYIGFVFLYSIIVLDMRPTLLDVVSHILNLQGINNLFLFIPYYPYPSCEILWFTTVIMACYLSLPIIQLFFELDIKSSIRKTIALTGVIGALVLTWFGVRIHYLLVFLIGYYFAKKEKKILSKNKAIVVTGSFVILGVVWFLRIILRPYLDGTILYDEIIAVVSMDALAVETLLITKILYVYIQKLFDKVSCFKWIRWLDETSFQIYMVHYLFFKGFWSVTNLTNNVIWQTILLIGLSVPSAVLFRFLCERFSGKICYK